MAPIATAATPTRICDRATPPNWRATTCTLAAIPFTHRLYVQSFSLDSEALQGGMRLHLLDDLNLCEVAKAITDAAVCRLALPPSMK